MQGVEPNTRPTEPFKAQKLNLTINRCGRVMDMRFHAVWGHCIAAGAIELHHTLQSMMICGWKCHAQHLDCLPCIPLINVGNKLNAH